MLIETPIRILKAIAEMVDPHVAIGKIVRDVSGQVIQIGEQIWDVGSSAAQTGVSLAEQASGTAAPDDVGEILDMSLVVFIQEGINTAFSDIPEIVRPTVDEHGLNLIGKIPWLIFPPPGPFGILYILFNLLEEFPWCPDPAQVEDLNRQCNELRLQLEEAPEPEMDVVRPDSTDDCQPPPESSGCVDDDT